MQTDLLPPQTSRQTTLTTNQTFLAGEFELLRLYLKRRIHWLRHKWQNPASSAPHGLPQLISDQQVDRLLQDEGEDDEAAYYRAYTGALNEAIDQALARQQILRSELRQSGQIPPLDWLSVQFGLNAFEQQVLVLCLAPEVDSSFGDIYAYVQDNATRRFATEELALQIFSASPAERLMLHGSFLPQAPLFENALLRPLDTVHQGTGELLRPLALPSRLADLLLGLNRLDETLTPFVHRIPSVPLHDAARQQAERLGQIFQDQFPASACWNLTGPENSSRMSFAGAACAAAGIQALRLDMPRLAGTFHTAAQWSDLRRLLRREAQISGLAWVIELTPDQPWEDMLNYFIESPPGLLLVLSADRYSSTLAIKHLVLPSPSRSELHFLWRSALDSTPFGAQIADPDLQNLVQQFEYGAETIALVLTNLSNTMSQSDTRNISPAALLWSNCREYASPRLESLARRVTPGFTWEDIVLPAELERQLREIASQVSNRFQVYENWGFGASMNRGRGISALFAGSSGVGKTMAAEILANHLHLDLYRIDLSGVVSKYIGETEKNLKTVFDAAEGSGAILFFDEADALFGKRTEVKDSHDRYANIEVNYLLQRMEDYRGLAILATNRKSSLDRAFMRRLRFLLDFPFPDAVYRRRIWEKVFPPMAPLSEGNQGLDLAALARLEIPGGNIRNIALNAAFFAAADASPITMRHIVLAAKREYSKMDKMVSPAEFGEYVRYLDQ